jgi:hypothetical protein
MNVTGPGEPGPDEPGPGEPSPRAGWPASLRIAVGICAASRFPMVRRNRATQTWPSRSLRGN